MITKTIFLFPETPRMNPGSFLKGAIMETQRTVKISGYNLYLFYNTLDETKYRFCVAPVKKMGKTTIFYQFKFPEDPPNFEELGFSVETTDYGNVIYLSMQSFISITAQTPYISLKCGNWADFIHDYHTLAAMAHLDVIPKLTRSILKEPKIVGSIMPVFSKLYDPSSSTSINLADLYSETCFMLTFFNYLPVSFPHKEANTFYFGALRNAANKFQLNCFPQVPLLECCITPGTIKQLRSMMRFVKNSLSKFGYSYGPDDYEDIVNVLHQFQKKQGIQEGMCGKQTLESIWSTLLSRSTDPIITLRDVGVSISLDNISENDKFGDIPCFRCDEVLQKIVRGISKSISPLPSPSSVVATTQKLVIASTKVGIEQFKGINNEVQVLETRVKSVTDSARNIRKEATLTSSHAESSLRLIDSIESMNTDVSRRIVTLKQRMQQEAQKTNTLVTFLLLLIGILVFLYVGNKRVSNFRSQTSST